MNKEGQLQTDRATPTKDCEYFNKKEKNVKTEETTSQRVLSLRVLCTFIHVLQVNVLASGLIFAFFLPCLELQFLAVGSER